MNVQEFAELAAGHALAALSPEDERAFQDALAAHPEWAAIADADLATAAGLAETVDAVAPPLALRGRLMSQIAGGMDAEAPAAVESSLPPIPPMPPLPPVRASDVAAAPVPPMPPVPASDEPRVRGVRASDDVEPLPGLVEPLPAPDDDARRPVEPPPTTEAVQTVARRNWTRGLLALAASFVLLIALGTTAVVIGDRLREPASVAALDQIDAAPDAQVATVEVESGGTATAHWSESLGKAVLVTDGVAEPGSGKTYELWFVRGDTPVSAGLFDTDDSGRATALLEEPMQAGDVIAVTVEDRGGSKTGQPTTDPVFTIPTA